MWVFMLCLCRIHVLQSPFIHQTTTPNKAAIPTRTPRVMSHSIFSLPNCYLRDSLMPLLEKCKIIGWRPR